MRNESVGFNKFVISIQVPVDYKQILIEMKISYLESVT